MAGPTTERPGCHISCKKALARRTSPPNTLTQIRQEVPWHRGWSQPSPGLAASCFVYAHMWKESLPYPCIKLISVVIHLSKFRRGNLISVACVVEDPCPRTFACSWQLLFLQHSALGNLDAVFPGATLCHQKESVADLKIHTLDKRLSVNTLHMSLCFTTSHAMLPSHYST